MKIKNKLFQIIYLLRKRVSRSFERLFLLRISKAIAKPSILPATIFSKRQINQITQEFNRFWGMEKKTPCLKQHEKFSTFTFRKPKSLWTYYFPNEKSISELKRLYRPTPFNIKTEDQTKLCGMHFKYQGPSRKHRRYLIIFNGNGELYRIGAQAWLFKLLTKHSSISYDIIMFDHRECGFSKGKAHAEGLVKDGEAIYLFVKNSLYASDDQIDLCGFSLGAAIATLVKSKYPHSQGVLISNRSFQSLDHVIKDIFSVIKGPLRRFFYILAKKITHISGWKLDPLSAWKTISSRKMVITHQEDPIIPHNASLAKALKKENLLEKCHYIALHQKNSHTKIKNHHVQPLSSYMDQHGNDVENEVFNFLNKFYN